MDEWPTYRSSSRLDSRPSAVTQRERDAASLKVLDARVSLDPKNPTLDFSHLALARWQVSRSRSIGMGGVGGNCAKACRRKQSCGRSGRC